MKPGARAPLLCSSLPCSSSLFVTFLLDIDKDDLRPPSWILRMVIVAQQLGTKDLPMPLEHDGSEDVILFFVTSKEIMDICTLGQEAWVSHLQLWCTYLHRLSIQKDTLELYGYLDPSFILKTCSNAAKVKAYIQKTLNASKKECYLAPYLEKHHWQLLILCPRQCVVVFLCSLHKVPDATFKDIIDIAMQAHIIMESKSRPKTSKRKPQWICPHSHRQSGGWECGFYVMKHMLNIVSASITDNWNETFYNPAPLSIKDIEDTKEHWANFFLEYSKVYL